MIGRLPILTMLVNLNILMMTKLLWLFFSYFCTLDSLYTAVWDCWFSIVWPFSAEWIPLPNRNDPFFNKSICFEVHLRPILVEELSTYLCLARCFITQRCKGCFVRWHNISGIFLVLSNVFGSYVWFDYYLWRLYYFLLAIRVLIVQYF